MGLCRTPPWLCAAARALTRQRPNMTSSTCSGRRYLLCVCVYLCVDVGVCLCVYAFLYVCLGTRARARVCMWRARACLCKNVGRVRAQGAVGTYTHTYACTRTFRAHTPPYTWGQGQQRTRRLPVRSVHHQSRHSTTHLPTHPHPHPHHTHIWHKQTHTHTYTHTHPHKHSGGQGQQRTGRLPS